MQATQTFATLTSGADRPMLTKAQELVESKLHCSDGELTQQATDVENHIMAFIAFKTNSNLKEPVQIRSPFIASATYVEFGTNFRPSLFFQNPQVRWDSQCSFQIYEDGSVEFVYRPPRVE